MNPQNRSSSFRSHWREVLLALSVIGTLGFWFTKPPTPQEQVYFNFADQRTFFGIPNFMDVTTNLAFLLVGIAGLKFCLKHRWEGVRPAWITFFVGLALVSVGSSYFHWHPTNETLVWDRLPMTIGFMGLFVVVLGEFISTRLARVLFLPALLLGLASVAYWQRFDDLRFYMSVQYMPQIAIPLIMVLFRSRYSHSWYFAVILGCYLLAKKAEQPYDRDIFLATQQLVSGHSLKHLLAAGGCVALVVMLQRRRLLQA